MRNSGCRMADIKGTLSICRRAGKLIGGMDEVKNSVRRREARVVLTASDFSEKSRKEIERLCGSLNIPLFNISENMDDIGYCVGKRYGVMSICDAGFAKAVREKLGVG